MSPAPAVQASVAGNRAEWNKWALPLLLACSFLIFVSASSIYLVISSQSSSEMMNRSLQLENRLWGILATLRVAESEQRGYLLTGDPAYLDDYRTTVDAGLAAVAVVKMTVASDPAQQRVLAEIEPLMVRKFAEMGETIRLHDAGDHVAALALVSTGVGHALMTEIRVAVYRLMDQQRGLASQHTSNSMSTNVWLLVVNLAGLALIIVLAVISVIVTHRAAGKELARSESRGDILQATMDQRRKIDRKFQEMLEAAPDAMVVVNQGGEIILLNLQAEKQFGYHRDELLGQKVTSIIPDGFAERLLADGLRSPADALAQQIGTGIELIGRRKDGAEFPIEIMLSPQEGTEGILVTAAIRNISVRRDAERHLAQMEARYRGLLEAAPDAMVVVNQGGEIILLNLQAEKQFGYRRDELLGQKVTNIIPDGFAERLLADELRSPADALAQQIGTGIELIGRRKDGAEFPIEIMLSPLESAEGMLVTAAIRDIGVRKDAEKHLAQMEARYRGLLEAAPDAMVVVNQGGEIILLNLQAEKEFGYRRDELLGQKVKTIIPDGFAERLLADGLRSPADALAQQMGTGIELIGRRKDGAEFPIEIMLSPLESAEGILVTAAIRDISVRRDAERHLAQMEARYRGLLEAAPDAMVVVNQGGEIILLNLQAEKEFGYRRDELLGQKVTNIIPEGFAERLIADGLRSAEDALAQQIGTGIELTGRRKDGTEFPIEIMLSPLESTEGMLVTAAIRDISVRRDAEMHLAQMEARYRGLLEAAPDAMVVVNQAGEIVLLNLQAEKEFGYRRDELLGQKVTNIVPDGFAERLIADGLRSAEDASAQQIGTGIELTGRRKDGAEFPIEIMLSPLGSAEGILVTAAIRDISVRKGAEQHLAQMEARSRGLLEAAPDAMVVVNKNAEIVLVNLQAKIEFGYRRAELLGQKVTCIIPEGFAERLLNDGVDAMAQQILKGIDLTGRRKRGDDFPIEIMLSPLASGEGILVVRDISLRKDEERRVARMESRYRGLLEAAPDAMVVVNHGGEIVLANLQAEKEFGYGQDELLGQNMKNIIPQGFAERPLAGSLSSAEDALTLQIAAGIERTGLRKDRSEFPVEIMLSPLESAEGILVIRDISARKHIERLKDEFVSTVSHELRTPLTSISGSLGLLVGQWASKLPESAARLLAIAHTNSQRLVRLINDILDIEKLESGHVVFNLNQVAVRSLVEHAIEDNRGFAESYGARVRLDADSVELDVNADPDRLAQVITNLLSNAIKFSPADGEVLVAVEKNANYARVTVRDHGSGVPDDFKLHIFEKFAQADATNTRQKGGTGLGLSIVKQIVERLGGRVGFDDAPGGGATFYVELPVWDGSAGGEIDLDSDASGTRILFCEDDREAAVIVREQLRQAGFGVDFAHTVAAAVARTNATRYAAILVDLQLPDGDGVGLIVRLRAQSKYRDTPIIVIAGDPEQGRSDVRSSRLNVLRWISKPIEFGPLIHILKVAITQPLRQRPRILHVDDDYDLLALVNHELHTIADVVSADSMQSARRTLASDQIDLVVLDISLGEESGLDLLSDIRGSLGNAIPVIIFSTHSADVACDEQIHATLSKINSSLESLGGAVRDQLALLPVQLAKDVA